MFVAAMAVAFSGTVWAVDPFTRVAVQDPFTGVKAQVDNARRVLVSDFLQGFDEDPRFFVRDLFGPGSSTCSNIYTVPAGKALIIQSMTAYLHNPSPGDDTEIILYGSASCSGLIAAAVSDRAHETVFQTFGSGIAIPAGRTVSALGVDNGGSATIYGYLVPASWVPPTAVVAETADVGIKSTFASPQ
jgi:hypothetical protein